MTKRISRRTAMVSALTAGVAVCGLGKIAAEEKKGSGRRVPVVDITDLYHPPQDLGDNLDLIAAYALPEIDLKAVILDVTQRYRRPYRNAENPSYDDPAGGRDPGVVPVTQLNYLFQRDVPCAVGPFESMRAPDDPMWDAPGFQRTGVELLLKVLRESDEPVEVVSFGSARPVAVAYNREPKLLREKMRCLHLCAGAAPAGYLEWNVQLDVHAFVRVLGSEMPVAIYPCATPVGAFDLGQYNTYWQLPDRAFIRRMHPRLRSYLAFAIDRTARMDFLCAVEDDPSEEVMQRVCGGPHHVWETAVWAQVARRKLVRRADGTGRLVREEDVVEKDRVVKETLLPGRVDVRQDGQFDFAADPAGRMRLYFREDPAACQEALREAFATMYEGFVV